MAKFFRGAILGAPASGKGTISGKIVKQFDVEHISTGDILRQHIEQRTELGISAKKYISEGKLVPNVLILKVILDKLKGLEDKNWLFDGFPRTVAQAEKLFMTYPLNLVINLKVPFDVIIDRVKGRRVHVSSGRVYHVEFSPPKVPGIDDVTGEPLIQRPDDKPEAVQERLGIYTETIGPLVDFYNKKGILKEFEGNTTAEIWPRVEKLLLQYMKPRSSDDANQQKR